MEHEITDTPETDAEIEHPENVMCDWYRAERLGQTEGDFPQVVAADHARRMERERNIFRGMAEELERDVAEARQEAERWRDESIWVGNEPDYWFPWEKGTRHDRHA